eukprot:gnl/MRDRNA2_/MRDRNA2_98098_c0_seq1.p1 gnl/MRDRNA2_/MRDRNA2_98098_c0~~gnl/MRDRNA2_/MRDRNA2_98098_c0_seq1.p1  ORF type:complete len:296 (+),score=55.81 gnl/MRDRNA2_/MRDRNA2_98098_c0_seq1:66-890(+)
MPARNLFFVAVCHFVHVLGTRHLRLSLKAQKSKPDQVNAPEMQHDALPKSPPHLRDITPGDGHEYIDYAAQKVADKYLEQVGAVKEGTPGDFYGSNCKEVCAACTIAADPEFPSCRCKASCQLGPDPTICPKKMHGWLNNKPTTPGSKWKAVCNAGHTDCDKCLDANAKAEIEKCKKDRIPAICFAKLKAQYGTAEATTRYCTRDEFAGCERFYYAPKEDGWICFDDQAKCEGSKIGKSAQDEQEEALHEAREMDSKVPPRDTRCVWCNIPIQK